MQMNILLPGIAFAGLTSAAVAWSWRYRNTIHDGIGARGRRFRAWAARPLTRHLALLGVVAVAAALSYVYLDRRLALLTTLDNDTGRAVLHVIGLIGRATKWYILFGLGFAGLWLAAKHPRFAQVSDRLKAQAMVPLYLGLSIALSGTMVTLIKMLCGRARPSLLIEHGIFGFTGPTVIAKYMSFPSGHASVITALMVGLYAIWPRYVALYVAIGTAVALSRVAESVHYLSDVVAAAYVAFLVTLWLRGVFVRAGIDLPGCAAGHWTPPAPTTWRQRLGLAPIGQAGPKPE